MVNFFSRRGSAIPFAFFANRIVSKLPFSERGPSRILIDFLILNYSRGLNSSICFFRQVYKCQIKPSELRKGVARLRPDQCNNILFSYQILLVSNFVNSNCSDIKKGRFFMSASLCMKNNPTTFTTINERNVKSQWQNTIFLIIP